MINPTKPCKMFPPTELKVGKALNKGNRVSLITEDKEWVKVRLRKGDRELKTYRSHVSESIKKVVSSTGNLIKHKREVVWGLQIRFWDNMDPNRQLEYRHSYARQITKNVIPEVINLQDIKNIVTYSVAGILPKIFIQLYHGMLMNKFLKYLIAYFQVYLEILEDLKWRRKFKHEKLKHPIAEKREKYCSKWLNKLRCRVGQEYSDMLMGVGEFMKYHHMNNPLMKSETVQDNFVYECLYKFSSKTVWIALGRRNFFDIELEIDHLFRTDKICPAKRRRIKSSTSLPEFDHDELNIIHGDSMGKDKFHLVSPVVQELFKQHDYPFLADCYTDLADKLRAKSMHYLKAISIVPEELYSNLGITLGILGKLREDYDIQLQFKEKEIEGEVAIAIARISRLSTQVKAIDETAQQNKLYETLNRFEKEIILPEHIEVDDLELEFTEFVHVLVSNQKDESNKYIKLWTKYSFDA